MKATRTVWAALLVVFLMGFTTACQRTNENKVQAARDDNAYPPANPSKVLSDQERDLAMTIEQSHLGEFDLARLAKQQANGRDVKSYADMIEDDHSGALKDVQKVMTNNGMPESTHSRPAEGQEKLATLQKMSGAAFDREFMNTMVSGHQKTLDELRSAQTSVQNADLKDYINDLIPKVQKHLEKAQVCRRK